MTVALLAACIFPPSFGLLGGHGLAGVVWPAFELHDEQLQLARSGNQFSKIVHALACFTLMPVSNIKTVLSVSVRGGLKFQGSPSDRCSAYHLHTNVTKCGWQKFRIG